MDFGLIPSSPTPPTSNDVAKTLYGVGGDGVASFDLPFRSYGLIQKLRYYNQEKKSFRYTNAGGIQDFTLEGVHP